MKIAVETEETDGPPTAVPVAVAADAAWFGNQSNQISLSPDAVVASQVYHFENMLRDVAGVGDPHAVGRTRE